MPSPILRWLDRLPIADAVDRRNARVIQVLLLFLALTIPATMAFGIAVTWEALSRGDFPWPLAVSLGFSALLSVLAMIGVWMIRRGRFRPTVRMLLAALITMLFVNALVNGFERQLPDQLAQMLVLILSGLVLGRKPLWLTFGLLVMAVGIGAARDAMVLYDETPLRALYNVPSTLFSYFLVSILIDRTTEALRETLRQSNERGEALAIEIRERERTHAQLIHAQKREVAERTASGMAHDFNNILSVIAGFSAERHHDDGGTDVERVEQLEDSLAAVEATARRGMAIGRRLLRFSRLDEARAEVFDAGDAIDVLGPMLRRLLEAPIVLQYERPDTRCHILFDRSEFELILLNLASNARDAIKGNGTFFIAVRSTTDRVIVVVADSGEGMPAEVAARVFEPFFSTKPADSGTGLGLTVVHDLITKASGSISVQSAPGRGTTFRMEFPRSH
ncbi:signal transduction histidine kinase [Xanthomonas campestris]|uniref:sensor histidine kinase n=1 Tax=Xanthomonas sp. CFBP 8151 TaxID=3035310 RepID=UPI00141B02AE|nr:ATP-binding protein [Xanthomonas sp. CFBP 8151]MEB1610519.1 ATP-binding protein [Xanthomonas campestris pv. campestris]NIJ78453.1 signal transduction histidine kinase [Xanthomonas sp. CFBP 8151]